MPFSPSRQGFGELSGFWDGFPASLLEFWSSCLLAVSILLGSGPSFCWKGRMEIDEVGSHCPPVMGSAPRACLGLLEGKDLMSPPWHCSHPSFSQLLCQHGSGFFSPFFFLPLEENSIVLFLVVTTWLLQQLLFCC